MRKEAREARELGAREDERTNIIKRPLRIRIHPTIKSGELPARWRTVRAFERDGEAEAAEFPVALLDVGVGDGS